MPAFFTVSDHIKHVTVAYLSYSRRNRIKNTFTKLKSRM